MKALLASSFILVCVTLLCFIAFYKIINSEIFQFAGVIVPRVETAEKVVALTFDDGPNEHLNTILQTLQEREVRATFYLIGEQIKENKESAGMLVKAGHEIGNHSYTHSRMVLKSKNFYRQEIDQTNQLIREIGYQGEITFRPPYGKKFIGLPTVLQERNLKTITWDVEPQKALGADVTSEKIVQYVKTTTRPGSIILIHPWYGEENQSRKAIAGIIDVLKEQGYTFVTVTELVEK